MSDALCTAAYEGDVAKIRELLKSEDVKKQIDNPVSIDTKQSK